MAIFDYQLTNDGDLVLDSTGRPTIITGQQAINQIIRQAMKLWQGDWEFDILRGVDWISILQKRFNRNAIIQTITNALLQVQYVDQVVDVFIRRNNDRTATITYIVFVNGEEIIGSEVV